MNSVDSIFASLAGVELNHAIAGRTVLAGPAVQLSEAPAPVAANAPRLGEHGDAVLHEEAIK